MLTKFDIGQHVNFWQSDTKYISGTINHIEINQDKEVMYSIVWDTEFLGIAKQASTSVWEENVFTNCPALIER